MEMALVCETAGDRNFPQTQTASSEQLFRSLNSALNYILVWASPSGLFEEAAKIVTTQPQITGDMIETDVFCQVIVNIVHRLLKLTVR
jgi:hypothetical protein